MTNPPNDQASDAPEKKIIVDEDWKSQVQAEKEELEQKQEEGEEKKEEEPSASADEAEAGGPEAEGPDGPMPPPSLEILATSMGMQAMMSMGLMPHPSGGEPKIHMNQAKHFVDTIAMLEEKTEGNRTSEESDLLRHLLHELRMAYVAVQKQQAEG
jgi:hypothetical protein